MDRVKQALRYHHYSYQTEKIYCSWITRFLKYHEFKLHPKDMGKIEIEQFLTYLAVDQKVATATQQQATSAILFFFKEVLNQDINGG